jgi:hypothetical protein
MKANMCLQRPFTVLTSLIWCKLEMQTKLRAMFKPKSHYLGEHGKKHRGSQVDHVHKFIPGWWHDCQWIVAFGIQ